MKSDQIPSGFVSALIRNEAATNAYAMMTREEKDAVLKKARAVRSRQEMDKLMGQLAKEASIS